MGGRKMRSRAAPRVSLPKHLATIESYLEDYRALCSESASDAINRLNNRDKFQRYILTSCWAKMYTRAEHWISIGMITSICNISEDSLSKEAKYEPLDSEDTFKFIQVDRDLTDFLVGGRDSYIKAIMEYHNDRMEGQFNGLKYDKEISLDPILNVETHHDENFGKVYKYTPEIAVTFHHLLVSSLLSYVFRLRIVDNAVRALPYVPNSKLPPLPVSLAFVQLLLSARLLFLVSHSRLFKRHLKSLNALLPIPTEANVERSLRIFADFEEWHTRHDYDKILMESIKALNRSSQPRTESVQASAVNDSESVVEASATTEESDADAGTIDEVLQDHSQVDFYRRWIMGLVDHFASIRVLERASSKLPAGGKINFSILGLNRPSLLSDSWDTMSKEIRTLCQDSSLVSKALESEGTLQPDAAISFMEHKIKAYEVPKTENKKTSASFEAKVYSFFKDLLSPETSLNPKPQFAGTGHCEAILMAIIYRIIILNDLDFSLKVCSP